MRADNMKIDQLLVEMIHQIRDKNHEPVEIILGHYMINELKNEIKDLITIEPNDKEPMKFMGIKIKEAHEYKFFIGIA